MFGKKAMRIKELEERIHEYEVDTKAAQRQLWEYETKVEYLKEENENLKDELAKIKPVIETSGFKPALSDKCDQCRYAYFSDYDNELIGCSKDVVCADFESSVNVER